VEHTEVYVVDVITKTVIFAVLERVLSFLSNVKKDINWQVLALSCLTQDC